MPDKPFTYDYIIAGAGAAGLSLMCYLLSHENLQTKRILLLDRDLKQTNDRTWCFWETSESPFESCLKSKWAKLHFHSQEFSALLDISPYRYKMLDSLSFYQHCFNLMARFPNVEFRQDEMVALEPNGIIRGKKAVYQAEYVFNSVLFQIPKLPQKHYLVQHFKGIFIRTPSPVFKPEEPTLMDFRVAQHGDCRFMYVLPVNAHEALVEYTGFSEAVLPQEEYDSEIQAYLRDFLHITDYDITHEEFGIIPMTDAPFSKQMSEQVINIGTAGGATKASTGYTFSFIQRQCAAIAQNLARGEKPLTGSEKTINKFAFYDSVFLRVLQEKKQEPWRVFHDMFSKLPASLILKFLNEETSLLEDLRIMNAVDRTIFLSAVIKQGLGSSTAS
ncbi:lycopene cyclase family protein [Rufibacter sediminis]|uniref:Lycopene cyclase n=1 Tax=Rufibacter sediminis TaxID=2762756 RepID=A0ABR6VU72_9BACT|nr:lycopene cyclase family protein [Rufibacter sediminis]MBC3540444.1 lycopene cyclase [Rufibacter sediminis]